ncbi:MAG: hypothetical protein ABJA74_14565 [Lapillicoccus sp.]
MPRYAVRPDDLGDAAALTAVDGPPLDAVRRLVAVAAGEAGAALGLAGAALAAAVEGYGQVEATVAVALAEAAGIISAGLASAASEYARADSAGALAFAGTSPGGGP